MIMHRPEYIKVTSNMNVFKSISVFCLCVFTAFSSFEYGITSLSFLVLAIAFDLFGGNTKILLSSVFWLDLAIVAITLISLVFTTDSSEGIRFFFRIFLCFLMSNLIVKDTNYIKAFCKGLIICATIIVISIYLQMLFPDQMLSVYKYTLKTGAYEFSKLCYDWNRAYSGICGYTNISAFFSSILCGYIFFYAIERINERKTSKAVICLLFSFLVLYAIILTNKRSIFMITIVELTFIMLFPRMNGKLGKRIVTIIFVISVIVLYPLLDTNIIMISFWNRLIGLGTSSIAEYSNGRFEIYKAVLYGFDNWIVGYGAGSSESVLAHAGGLHNIYLQIFYENGLVGVALWLVLFVTNLLSAFKRSSQAPNIMLLLSIYVQILFLTYGLSGNPLYDETIFCCYCIFSIMPYCTKTGGATYEPIRRNNNIS